MLQMGIEHDIDFLALTASVPVVEKPPLYG